MKSYFRAVNHKFTALSLCPSNHKKYLPDFENVTITVSEVNASPTLSTIGSKSVAEDVLLTFTASASDSSDVPANSLTFSLINAPVGASIGSGTGVFTWTPSESQGPNSYNVTVRVTDNGSPNPYDEETITITIRDPIYVDGSPGGNGSESQPYEKVQDAINAAVDGDRIIILYGLDGNYLENIDTSETNKRLRIESQGGTVRIIGTD